MQKRRERAGGTTGAVGKAIGVMDVDEALAAQACAVEARGMVGAQQAQGGPQQGGFNPNDFQQGGFNPNDFNQGGGSDGGYTDAGYTDANFTDAN